MILLVPLGWVLLVVRFGLGCVALGSPFRRRGHKRPLISRLWAPPILLEKQRKTESCLLKAGAESPWIGLYSDYKKLCETKPLLTKSLSQSMIGGIGSILSQYVHTIYSGYQLRIDWMQVRAFMTSGLVFEGPYCHWWYERLWMLGRWLENRKNPISPSFQTSIQILIDQTLGVILFFPTYFFVYELIQSAWGIQGMNTNMISSDPNAS